MPEPEEHRRARLAARAAKYREQVAGLRALRDQVSAELCSHGVRNCNDHRTTSPAHTERRETEPDQPKEGDK